MKISHLSTVFLYSHSSSSLTFYSFVSTKFLNFHKFVSQGYFKISNHIKNGFKFHLVQENKTKMALWLETDVHSRYFQKSFVYAANYDNSEGIAENSRWYRILPQDYPSECGKEFLDLFTVTTGLLKYFLNYCI